MQQSQFLTQIMNNSIIGGLIKDNLHFKFHDFIPPLDRKADEIYIWRDAIIGDYHFKEIYINVGSDDVPLYRSPIFMIRLTTDDLSLFDQSIEHFGVEGLEVKIPPTDSDDPLKREWRKKLGRHIVLDKEIKVTASKFATTNCVLKLAIYTV